MTEEERKAERQAAQDILSDVRKKLEKENPGQPILTMITSDFKNILYKIGSDGVEFKIEVDGERT